MRDLTSELRKKLREKMNDLADDLASGAAQDFHQYKYLVGVIYGLAQAESDLLELSREINGDPED